MLKILVVYHEKQKSFVPKIYAACIEMYSMLVIETLKSKTSDVLNSKMCFCSRLYDISK